MWILSKFMLKRDKFQLLGWTLGLVLLCVAVAGAYGEMFGSTEELMGMVMTLENPAMIAMLGPIYGHTVAAIFSQNMMVFTAIAVAIMNVFMVARHTRADEEEGRLEVLRSLPIGRTTTLKAVLVNVTLVNLVLGLLIGLGIAIVGMEVGVIGEGLTDFNGAMLFGTVMGVTGLVFATFTALFVQLSANNRTVLSYAFGFLGVTYLLRGIGDMNAEVLSLVSPLGLGFRTEAFVGNYWWPVVVMLVLSVVVSGVALYLNDIRDLGAGFIAEKPGRSHGNWLLKTPFGLALKLSKGQLIGWGVISFVLGASYGSIFGDIEAFISSNDMFQQIFAGFDSVELTAAFMSFIVVMLALIIAIPVISIVLKVKAEEKKNRMEHVISRAVSRWKVLVSYSLIAAVSAPVMLFLLALGLFAASGGVMEEAIPFGMMVRAVMVYLPALWVLLGLTVFLIGVLPKLTGLAWFYLGYSFIIVYLGQLLDLPDWMALTTPFGFIPSYPMERIEVLPLIVLILIADVLLVIGLVGYRKRDLQG